MKIVVALVALSSSALVRLLYSLKHVTFFKVYISSDVLS